MRTYSHREERRESTEGGDYRPLYLYLFDLYSIRLVPISSPIAWRFDQLSGFLRRAAMFSALAGILVFFLSLFFKSLNRFSQGLKVFFVR